MKEISEEPLAPGILAILTRLIRLLFAESSTTTTIKLFFSAPLLS
jgi:hypothetical protein